MQQEYVGRHRPEVLAPTDVIELPREQSVALPLARPSEGDTALLTPVRRVARALPPPLDRNGGWAFLLLGIFAVLAIVIGTILGTLDFIPPKAPPTWFDPFTIVSWSLIKVASSAMW
jgi:hypothetical protein